MRCAGIGKRNLREPVWRRSFRSGACPRRCLHARWFRLASGHVSPAWTQNKFPHLLWDASSMTRCWRICPQVPILAENVGSFTPSPMLAPCSTILCRFKPVRSSHETGSSLRTFVESSSSRMLKKPTSGVLASLRGSTRRELFGGRKHWRDLSVHQDPFKERTAHTKCGTYLLASSLAAALMDDIFEHPPRCVSVSRMYRPMKFRHEHRVFAAAC